MMKQILKSKTMRFALAIEFLGVLEMNTGFLSQHLTPTQMGVVLILIGFGIRAFRLMTTMPVSEK